MVRRPLRGMLTRSVNSQHLQGCWAWLGLCAVWAVACVVVWLLPVEWQIALRWRTDSWVSEPWTVWTASFTHLSDMHLIVNLLTLVCLAIVGAQSGCKRDEVVAVLLAWPLSTLALLLWPQVQFYAGFSGLNHALALILIAQGALNFVVKHEFSGVVFLLAVLLMVKIIWETPWSVPMRHDTSWGFTVVQAAHLSGLLAAAMAAAVIYTARIFLTKAVVE